jgi:hypothetical protein
MTNAASRAASAAFASAHAPFAASFFSFAASRSKTATRQFRFDQARRDRAAHHPDADDGNRWTQILIVHRVLPSPKD